MLVATTEAEDASELATLAADDSLELATDAADDAAEVAAVAADETMELATDMMEPVPGIPDGKTPCGTLLEVLVAACALAARTEKARAVAAVNFIMVI